MSTFQSAFDDLEREVKAMLEAAGYAARSVVLKAKLDPHTGWEFELLAALPGASVRKQLVKPGEAHTADELVRVLRDKVAVSQLQPI